MRGRLLLGLFVLGLAAVTAAVAGVNANWSVHATGASEVPPHETHGQAQAIFHLSPDGSSLDYKLIAANIDNVVQAHIHMAHARSERDDRRVALSVDHGRRPGAARRRPHPGRDRPGDDHRREPHGTALRASAVGS